ncbi:MAG: NnrS family protein, partial [Burkholderiaceae bacterium]
MPDDRWRFARLLAEPHRLGFFAAAVMLAVDALWWLAVQAAALLPDAGVRWAVAPGHAHALLMLFSFMPMFIGGFLFTTGPRWLAAPAPAARSLLPVVACWLAGWALFLIGVHTHAQLAAVGLAAAAAGWSLFTGRFARMLWQGTAADRSHPRAIGIACGLGAAALWAAAAGLWSGTPRLVRIALAIGLWCFLAPVFMTALHRMFAVLGAAAPRLDARHPNWLLWTLLAALALQAPLSCRFAACTRPALAATATATA